MIIAISSQGKELTSEIDPRFGRCQIFIFFNSETKEFETFENQSINAGQGAGIQSAQFVVNKNAQVVITGNVGPKAYQVLSAAGITIYTGMAGIITEALKKYEDGSLQSSSAPSVDAHFGQVTQESQKTTNRDTLRIAISAADDKGLDSAVSPHFGRCPYYTIAEVKDNKILLTNIVQNPYFNNHGVPRGCVTFFPQLGHTQFPPGPDPGRFPPIRPRPPPPSLPVGPVPSLLGILKSSSYFSELLFILIILLFYLYLFFSL